MSTGGIFQLITNDGKQDKMLMATALLNRRLAAIRRARSAAGLDPTPTLADIEKTHVLFVNAHFKPFTAIAYEYSKVRAPGQYNLGQDVQFSIPQFGDFFADMILYVKFKGGTWNQDLGTNATAPQVRWCNYVGERLLQKVSFTVNGNPLDEYTPNAVNVWREYYVLENKRRAWNQCVGQENPRDGYLAKDVAGGPAAAASLPRVQANVCDGPQTGSAHTEALQLWIPLLFWFNKDLRLAVPSVAIPYGQRFVTVSLASQDQILGRLGRSTNSWLAAADSSGVRDTKGTTTANPTVPTQPVALKQDLKIDEIQLYVNNLFVNPEIHEIFIKRIGFNLIRVHREQVITCTKNSDEILLNQMKWPIETLYVGMKIKDYSSGTYMEQYLDRWHKFCKVVDMGFTSTTGGGAVVEYQVEEPTIDQLSISAHGIPIYDEMPEAFFNYYVPYQYGGPNLQMPKDRGLCMVNFCLYPGAYQPSGHINVSRAREFYIKYTSSVIGASGEPHKEGQLVVLASAINFLLISDGSAVLRYST